ncbi:MAG: hypothetical protein NWF01_05230, partial [Candidatus Bathyarchaeota archaeon]|nr:hypothetical protein [Candidatus Bathyarchaeota archaeon]
GKLNQTVISQYEVTDWPYDPYTVYTWNCNTTLPQLPNGTHNITIYEGPNRDSPKVYYTPLLTFYFTINATAPTSTHPNLTETTTLITGTVIASVVAATGVAVYRFRHSKPAKTQPI